MIVELDLNNWIYSSLPEDIKPETSEGERDELFYLLAQYNEPVSAARLSKMLGHEWKNGSVKVRKLITEMIIFQGVPIVSSGTGFKLARNRNELLNYHESLSKRLKGLRRRVLGVERIIAVGAYGGIKW